MAKIVEVVLLIGIPGSGKSTFYAQNFAETHTQISLDDLHTRKKEFDAFCSAMSAGKSCVIDNTNVSRAEREHFLTAARKFPCRIIGYYFRSVIDECRIRNEQRKGRKCVPEAALKERAAKLEMPSKTEGFDELYYVAIVNDRFEIQPWKEEPEDGKA